MSLCEFHWSSAILRKRVTANVILPDVGVGPFPVFYLLHGLSDDFTTWVRRTRVEWYARNLPLIIVCPDGFRGFYTNADQGPAYADYIAAELPAVIERNFQARSDCAGRCIGGLSMGGYGAMRVALGHPDRYCSANSHSGAVAYGEKPAAGYNGPLFPFEFEQLFGQSPRGTDHDLLALAARAKASGQPPHLRIDCGTEDHLLEQSRSFHRGLDALGISHEYAEFPGDHNWDYWDTHIKDALAFHSKHLGIIPIIPLP